MTRARLARPFTESRPEWAGMHATRPAGTAVYVVSHEPGDPMTLVQFGPGDDLPRTWLPTDAIKETP